MAQGARDVAGRRYALAIMAFIDADEASAPAWEAAVDGLEALTDRRAYVKALQADGMTDEKLQEIVRRTVPGIGEAPLNLVRLLRRKGGSRSGLRSPPISASCWTSGAASPAPRSAPRSRSATSGVAGSRTGSPS